MRRTIWASVVGIVALLVILIGLNGLAERFLPQRLDLTQGRLYTLSAGTRTVLAGLKDPVTLRLFYSRRLGAVLPVYGAYADRVTELLREYVAASNGKVQLQVLDPEPFTDTEDRALAYGLQGVPIDQSGEQVFFGLAGANLLDDERQIGFLKPDREQFLEYDLTRLVFELSSPQRPVVGLITSLPLDGDPRAMMASRGSAGRPWASMLQLRQSVNVRPVAPDAQQIDPDIQVLLVAQPEGLSDATLYAIDQFVLRGGRLMAMVDPHSDAADQPGPGGEPPTHSSSALPRLFEAWGVKFDPEQVVGDLTGAWRVRASASDRVQAVDYIAWFNIQDGINHTDPATADLKQVTVASAGALSKADGADIEFTPLLSSSLRSGLVPAARVRTDPQPARILGDFKPDGVRRVIAARVRGVLHSAFPGPPDLPPGLARAPNLPAHLAQSAGPANLVLVADTDLLADRFWVRVQDFFGQSEATPFSDNGPFVANLIGTLAGGDALIGLRSRGESLRPFTRVDDMQRTAEARFRQTEQALQTKLDATQKRLGELRQGGGGQAVISQDQRATIDALRTQVADTRRELRGVQLDLRRDISRLQTLFQVLDIAAMPAVLAVLAALLAVWRGRRRAGGRA